MLALFAICTIAACSKNETLERLPHSGDTDPGLNLRAEKKENYWARCRMENGLNGHKCTYGGWGCGSNQNTPRCIARSTPHVEALGRFTASELEVYYSGQLTSEFVQAHLDIFTEIYNLGLGDEPGELISKLRDAGL